MNSKIGQKNCIHSTHRVRFVPSHWYYENQLIQVKRVCSD